MTSTTSSKTAEIKLPDTSIDVPVITGTEGEQGLDVTKLRAETGFITVDPGYGNTGSCQSAITFIDGEKGILRHRGYAIEELAEKSTFVEVAYMLIFGKLPTAEQLTTFQQDLTNDALLHQDMRHHFEGFPATAHPMAVLSSMINACSCYYPELLTSSNIDGNFSDVATKLMAKVATIAAFSYKKSQGHPQRYPDPALDYVDNFLHCMFSQPYNRYEADPVVHRALDLFLMLHADHEQNCSTSTARMVGSSEANLFASMSAAVCALWGPLHGGANQRCIEMLQNIHDDPALDVATVVESVKQKKFRLMGFGHRVYKNFDPRARILKKACDDLFEKLGKSDPLLDIAKQLEEAATQDDYFLQRKLYPNVDFYSGILLRTLGIPVEMFTVMFAIGRMPGWIAHWREQRETGGRIHRPRQIYIGENLRDYTPIDAR